MPSFQNQEAMKIVNKIFGLRPDRYPQVLLAEGRRGKIRSIRTTKSRAKGSLDEEESRYDEAVAPYATKDVGNGQA
jgi:hypothetical protein